MRTFLALVFLGVFLSTPFANAAVGAANSAVFYASDVTVFHAPASAFWVVAVHTGREVTSQPSSGNCDSGDNEMICNGPETVGPERVVVAVGYYDGDGISQELNLFLRLQSFSASERALIERGVSFGTSADRLVRLEVSSFTQSVRMPRDSAPNCDVGDNPMICPASSGPAPVSIVNVKMLRVTALPR